MKKYIITEKPDNKIAEMGEKLSVQENGNWLLVNENHAFPNTICYAYDASGQIAPTTDPSTIGEPIEIPEGIKAEEYCYTADDGFYPRPDYEEESE